MSDVLAALRKKYSVKAGNGQRYVFATEVRNDVGFRANRAADAMVLDTWESSLGFIGFEIKHTRSDWLTELKDPGKWLGLGKFCRKWYLVVPDPKIVKGDEIPKSWGLMVVKDGHCSISHPAKKLDPEPVTMAILTTFARAFARSDTAGFKAEYDRGYLAAMQKLESAIARRAGDDAAKLKSLQGNIVAFEKASGVKIDEYMGEMIGRQFAAATVLGRLLDEHHGLEGVADRLESAAEQVRETRKLLGNDGS